MPRTGVLSRRCCGFGRSSDAHPLPPALDVRGVRRVVLVGMPADGPVEARRIDAGHAVQPRDHRRVRPLQRVTLLRQRAPSRSAWSASLSAEIDLLLRLPRQRAIDLL